MPLQSKLKRRLPLVGALTAGLLNPATAWAQAAVLSDQPSSERSGTTTLPRESSTGADHDTLPTPNPTTAPGAPGTTGTGAAGTGPSNTMAAPGR